MPTALPNADKVDLSAPNAAEVLVLSRGVASAVAPADGLTATQQLLVRAVFRAMTGHQFSVDTPAIEPAQFAALLFRRDLVFRGRIVQIMVLLGLVLHPMPTDVAERIAAFAKELLVEEDMVDVAKRFAEGNYDIAATDFERNGYVADWGEEEAASLHTSRKLRSTWQSGIDTDLAKRWATLEKLPDGSLGHRVSQFYRARGFSYPGMPGSAPPLLAQHDWVHVLADYGTTVESELEVFALIARANDNLRAFSLLAMVVSLFETGHLQAGAGLFEASPGHLSQQGMAERLADAMRRGSLCLGSTDFLGVDWFELADLPVEEARSHFCIPRKSLEAVTAGSAGPWEPGGISPFQVRAGTALADSDGRRYDSFGAQIVEETA